MNILVKRPIISEKSMKLAKMGLYTFLVDKFARKPLIAKNIEEKFDVKVVEVKTANFKDEVKSQRQRRGSFTIPGYKKALVRLKKGQKITLFEAEAKEETPEGEGKKETVKEKKSLFRGTKVKVEKESRVESPAEGEARQGRQESSKKGKKEEK